MHCSLNECCKETQSSVKEQRVMGGRSSKAVSQGGISDEGHLIRDLNALKKQATNTLEKRIDRGGCSKCKGPEVEACPEGLMKGKKTEMTKSRM